MFETQKVWSADDLKKLVAERITLLNRDRVPSEQLTEPSLRTLQRRLSQLPAFDVAVARYGHKEAERRFKLSKSARLVTRILELVEVDHSPLDILVVNEAGNVVARPTITVLLDRFSRMVLGFHISAAGHGTDAVMEALKHALLPKCYLKERYADLGLEWNAFGWMERLLMDNGREFHSDALADALIMLSIVAEYAKSKEPDDKAHVERFLRTLNYSFIHKLPGTTFAKIHDRVGFKAEDEARVTLAELDRLVHVWICDQYHKRPHKGLDGRTPEAVWDESARSHPPQLKMTAEQLSIELAEVAECALQHYGLDLNCFRYSSEQLSSLYRLLPSKSKVTVKWPRDDAGKVWVWNPMDDQYVVAENTRDEFAGLTVKQAKAVLDSRNEQGQEEALTTPSAPAKVQQILDTINSSAKLKDKKQGQRLANSTSKAHREDPIVVPPPPDHRSLSPEVFDETVEVEVLVMEEAP
jgi:putative transposase